MRFVSHMTWVTEAYQTYANMFSKNCRWIMPVWQEQVNAPLNDKVIIFLIKLSTF